MFRRGCLVPAWLCFATVSGAPVLPPSPDAATRQGSALEKSHSMYDAGERLLRKEVPSYNYHSKLTHGIAHPLRQSANYAVALMDTGDEDMRLRALAVLGRVLDFQDTNPASRTYGIWPYYMEEPLEKMTIPDWNWADFIGTQLLELRLTHADRLPAEMMARVDQAIRHAANSIRKRNIGPGYTNIAIMGSFVTLATAEAFGNTDLEEYAMARWRKFHEHTMKLGGFTEFNSPAYTVIALDELLRIITYVKNPEALGMAREIYALAWKEIAVRYHPPTGQWSGPHSRAYSSLLTADTQALIDRATGSNNPPSSGSSKPELRLNHRCPVDLLPYFNNLKAPRTVTQTFATGERPVIGTTWLTPEFSLGTVNRGDLWNQRRSLIAYWGDRKAPSYLHLRFLRDGYDYAATQFFSVQREGEVIAALNFATDGGNKHVSIDRIKDSTIQARDLRLRFEFGGAAGGLKIPVPSSLESPVAINHGNCRINIAIPHAMLGDSAGRWESGSDGVNSWLDVVIHAGDEQTFDFSKISHAALGIALRLSPAGEAAADNSISATATTHGGLLSLKWKDMAIQIPMKPDKAGNLQHDAVIGIPPR